jgi:hypothetical protein
MVFRETVSVYCENHTEHRNKLFRQNDQNSLLQTQRFRVRFPALPDFPRSNGSGTGALSLVSAIEQLLGRKSSGSDLETREYDRRDPSRKPRGTLYPQKLALTSPTSCGRLVGIVRSQIQATEFFSL